MNFVELRNDCTGQAKYRPDFRRLPVPVLNPARFSKRRPGNYKGEGGGGGGLPTERGGDAPRLF